MNRRHIALDQPEEVDIDKLEIERSIPEKYIKTKSSSLEEETCNSEKAGIWVFSKRKCLYPGNTTGGKIIWKVKCSFP